MAILVSTKEIDARQRRAFSTDRVILERWQWWPKEERNLFFPLCLALGKFLLGVTASRAWHYLGLASVRSLAALLVDTNGSLTTRNSINTEAEPPLKTIASLASLSYLNLPHHPFFPPSLLHSLLHPTSPSTLKVPSKFGHLHLNELVAVQPTSTSRRYQTPSLAYRSF